MLKIAFSKKPYSVVKGNDTISFKHLKLLFNLDSQFFQARFVKGIYYIT